MARTLGARFLGDAEVLNLIAEPGGTIRLATMDRRTARKRRSSVNYVRGCDGTNPTVCQAIGSTIHN
nr:hypothetical protein [Mycobacteroides chelonae]